MRTFSPPFLGLTNIVPNFSQYFSKYFGTCPNLFTILNLWKIFQNFEYFSEFCQGKKCRNWVRRFPFFSDFANTSLVLVEHEYIPLFVWLVSKLAISPTFCSFLQSSRCTPIFQDLSKLHPSSFFIIYHLRAGTYIFTSYF